MTTPPIRIMGQPGEAMQADCTIARVGRDWYIGHALNLRKVGRLLRDISEVVAGNLGEVLHHADWTITSDPDEVRRLSLPGEHASCQTCIRGTEAALDWLDQEPGNEVAVGQMWWRVHA